MNRREAAHVDEDAPLCGTCQGSGQSFAGEAWACQSCGGWGVERKRRDSFDDEPSDEQIERATTDTWKVRALIEVDRQDNEGEKQP